MLRNSVAIGLICTVAACGDPLSGLDKIADVDLSQTDPTAAALPSEAEVAREGYFGTDAAKAQTGTEGALPAEATPAEPVKRRGLLSLLRPAPDQPEAVGAPLDATGLDAPADTPADAAADPEAPAAAVVQDANAAPTDVPTPDAGAATDIAAVAPVVAEAPAKRGGLLGLLRRASPKATPAVDAAPVTPEVTPAAPQSAVVDTNTDTAAIDDALKSASLDATPKPKPARRGLFGRAATPKAKAPRTGPDAKDVTYGTTIAYGLVARVCDAKGKNLGRRVAKAPARGYSLYDSAPGAAVARTWYLTGFEDGCPRQITAANVLLGSATLYEQLHYGPTGKHLPVGTTDKAYEGVKRKICGTRKGKPCGAKLSKMQNSTFFVSAYDSFGNSRRWSEMLVHDGQVLALAVKTNS